MKKNYLRRITALSAALAVIAGSAVSCEKKSGKANKDKPVAKELMSASYRATEIESDIELGGQVSMKKVNDDTIVISTFDYEKRIPLCYTTNMDFTDFTPVELDLGVEFNDDTIVQTAVSPEGDIYALATFTEYGDIEKPDFESPDFDYENFDFDEYYNSLSYTYKIYCVDLEGNVKSSADINGLDSESEEGNISIQGIVPCGDGKLICNIYDEEERRVVINSDGSVGEDVEISDMEWVNSMTYLSDNTIAACGYMKNGFGIKLIDCATMKEKDEAISISDSNMNVNTVFEGSGEYKFYVDGSTGLFGIKEDGSATEIVNWVDSDMGTGNVTAFIPMDNGDFIVVYSDYSSDVSTSLYRLTKRDASEIENTKVITIGVMYDDWQVKEKVSAFNKSHDDVRFKITDYSKYDEYNEETETMENSAAQQLKLDIVSGKAPDMIVSYNRGIIKSLANKGLFVDLYEFLEKDTELKKEDIMPNVLEACEIGGKLFSLSPYFNIETIVAKTKFVDTPDWTLEQLMETYEKLPKDMKLTQTNSREEILSMVLYNIGETIDYEKGTCNFDTPELRKFVEFSEQFPSQEEAIDWQDENAMNEIYNDDNYRNDKVLLSNMYIYDFRNYTAELKGKFNEPITFVGYPTDNGKGGVLQLGQNFAILSNATDKDICWNFIKECFAYDESDEETSMYMSGLPSLRKPFDRLAEESMKKPTYKDENGNIVEDDIYYYGQTGREMKVDPLTEEEKNFIVDYIMNTTRTSGDIDPEVQKILEEELMAYMEGEQTADAAITNLQGRISTLVSEQS